ncbi:MAG: thiol reductant ABC exporter subunit CydC [Caldilineaceae bacterium]
MSTIARLLKLIGPFGWWIVLGVLLSAATSVASVGLMAVSAYLISKAAVSTTLVDLSLLITGVRFFAISRAGLRYAERYINHKATFRILTRLRVWFYSAIEPLAPAALAAQHSGDLLARIVADIETLENFYLRVLIPPLSAVLVTAAACWILGLFNAILAWALLAFVLLTGVVLPLLGRYLSRQAAQEVIGLRADLNVALLDGVQGMADLLAYGQERRQQALVEALSQELHRRQARLALIRGVSNGLGILFTGLAGITVLGLAMPLVHGGQIDGVFLALLPLTAIAAFEAIQPLAQSLQWLEISQAAANRIFALIDTPPAVHVPLGPHAPHVPRSPHALVRVDGTPACPRSDAPSITITGLSFRYASDEPWTLDNLSLSIPAGSSLGIMGPNGSGKSTLANLFVRFWDYSEGSIRIDDTELRELPADEARELFGVVPQHTHLFNAAVRDNLYLANPDACDDELVNACRQAQIHDFIANLPQGYDTMIGENGVLFSGGERQRLAIARAVLKAAPILILDEATSQLDPLTEQALLASLRPFMAGRTTIVISHRQAAIAYVDQMVVFDQGRVA